MATGRGAHGNWAKGPPFPRPCLAGGKDRPFALCGLLLVFSGCRSRLRYGSGPPEVFKRLEPACLPGPIRA